MTQQEILELRIKIANNDIMHFNKNMGEADKQIEVLNRKKSVIAQKISKKQIYIGLLEKDIENLN